MYLYFYSYSYSYSYSYYYHAQLVHSCLLTLRLAERFGRAILILQEASRIEVADRRQCTGQPPGELVRVSSPAVHCRVDDGRRSFFDYLLGGISLVGRERGGERERKGKEVEMVRKTECENGHTGLIGDGYVRHAIVKRAYG